MKRIVFVAAVVAAGAASPAGAAQYDNSRMPFPAMMNALFGNPDTTGATSRRDDPAQPSYARPAQVQPGHVQPGYVQSGHVQSRAAYNRPAGFVQPGQRLPSYSGTTASAPGTGNLYGLQPPPSNYVPARQTQQQLPQFDPAFAPKVVAYDGLEKPGTIVIDTNERFLYLVQDNGSAMRYGVGVGRPGFEWAGTHTITRKAEWPDWTPPEEMKQRQPGLPDHVPGGPRNPLGARAMYLGSTLYRIHGSNEPWTIGRAVSSGCIRMRNEDVIDLYERVRVGTTVKVI